MTLREEWVHLFISDRDDGQGWMLAQRCVTLTSSSNRLTVMTSPSEHASARVGTMELEPPRPFRFSLPDDDDDEDADEDTEESLPFPAPSIKPESFKMIKA